MSYPKYVIEWCSRTRKHLDDSPTLKDVVGNVHGLYQAQKVWKEKLRSLFDELYEETKKQDIILSTKPRTGGE